MSTLSSNTPNPPSETPPSEKKTKKRLLSLGLTGIFLLACLIFTFAVLGISPQEFLTWAIERWQNINEILQQIHPIWIFVLLLLLPTLPIPISPLLFACGVALKAHNLEPTSIALIVGSAVFLNSAWSYWLAAAPARQFVNFLLKRSNFEVPTLSKSNAISTTLLLRLTPGVPYFLHALILGFLRVPYVIYLLLSLVTSIPICIAFALLGKEAADGNIGKAALVLFFILLFVFGSKLAYSKLSKNKKAANTASSSTEPTIDLTADIPEAEIIAEETLVSQETSLQESSNLQKLDLENKQTNPHSK